MTLSSWGILVLGIWHHSGCLYARQERCTSTLGTWTHYSMPSIDLSAIQLACTLSAPWRAYLPPYAFTTAALRHRSAPPQTAILLGPIASPHHTRHGPTPGGPHYVPPIIIHAFWHYIHLSKSFCKPNHPLCFAHRLSIAQGSSTCSEVFPLQLRSVSLRKALCPVLIRSTDA